MVLKGGKGRGRRPSDGRGLVREACRGLLNIVLSKTLFDRLSSSVKFSM